MTTVGVGDRPEIIDQETPIPGGRGNGNGGRKKAAKRSAKKRITAADVEVSMSANAPKDRRLSRERSLNRLLAGLRAVNAGDFSVQLTANGDPLMADIIEVFNSVTAKQSRLVDGSARVGLSVGREGKMRERVTISGVAGQWAAAIDSVNSLITDLVQPT